MVFWCNGSVEWKPDVVDAAQLQRGRQSRGDDVCVWRGAGERRELSPEGRVRGESWGNQGRAGQE